MKCNICKQEPMKSKAPQQLCNATKQLVEKHTGVQHQKWLVEQEYSPPRRVIRKLVIFKKNESCDNRWLMLRLFLVWWICCYTAAWDFWNVIKFVNILLRNGVDSSTLNQSIVLCTFLVTQRVLFSAYIKQVKFSLSWLLLYESFERKPGWRFTARCQMCV